VHPRVRGGTVRRSCQSASASGASPRARGNRGPRHRRRGRDGCIPACAGEPANRRRMSFACAVHPRVRGGTRLAPPHCRANGGASPRARGNRRAGGQPVWRAGCIPACAGEPRLDPPGSSWPGVHPRVRGGTGPTPRRNLPAMGASPRARGNRHRQAGRNPPEGCIPACAGEPRQTSPGPASPGVHPRVRGGTQRDPSWIDAEGGASPRARGNRVQRQADDPAQGASPRARGNRAPWRLTTDHAGCIPACAGEPRCRGGSRAARTVHPRVRGGTRNRRSHLSVGAGASPRARGNLLTGLGPRGPVGCIPACAGEPTAPR